MPGSQGTKKARASAKGDSDITRWPTGVEPPAAEDQGAQEATSRQQQPLLLQQPPAEYIFPKYSNIPIINNDGSQEKSSQRNTGALVPPANLLPQAPPPKEIQLETSRKTVDESATLLRQIEVIASRKGASAEEKKLAQKAQNFAALANAALAVAESKNADELTSAKASVRAATLALSQRPTRGQAQDDDISNRISKTTNFATTAIAASDQITAFAPAISAANEAASAVHAIHARMTAAPAPAPAPGESSKTSDSQKFSKDLSTILRKFFANIRSQVEAENIHAKTVDIAKYIFYFDAHINYLKWTQTGDPHDYSSAASWTKWTKQKRIDVQILNEDGLITHTITMDWFGAADYDKYPEKHYPFVQNLFGINNALIKYKSLRPSLNNSIYMLKNVFYEANRTLIQMPKDRVNQIEPLRYYKSADSSTNGSCMCFLCGKIIKSTEIPQPRASSSTRQPLPVHKIKGQVEHIVPFLLSVLLGVINTPLNYGYAHQECNGSKSQKVPDVPEVSPERPSPFAIVLNYLSGIASDTVTFNEDDMQEGGRVVLAKASSDPTLRKIFMKTKESRRSTKGAPRSLQGRARKAERYFAGKVSETLVQKSVRPGMTTVARLYIFALLRAFYDLVASGSGKAQRARSDRSQSGGTLNPYVVFLRDYSDKVAGPVAWSEENRAAFLKNRYEAAFAFSERYFREWQSRAGADQVGATYEDFIANRVDSLLLFGAPKPDDLVRHIII